MISLIDLSLSISPFPKQSRAGLFHIRASGGKISARFNIIPSEYYIMICVTNLLEHEAVTVGVVTRS